ncbi:MAG: amino acid adenylation domain-containing protein [Kibdelosporangium sp.]
MQYPLDLFAARVAEAPHATALVFDDRTMSFAELDRAANQLAHFVAAQGVRREQPVGLRLRRGFGTVVGVLGVLKSGAAYLPLDPAYPADRLGWMASDAGASLVITDDAGLPGGVPLADAIEGRPVHAPDVDVRPENLAYLMYTSGSTGQPKGVAVEHRNLAHVFAAWNDMYGLLARPLRFVSVTGFGVDLFLADLLRSVFAGGTMIIAPERAIADPALLLDLVRRYDGDAIETLPGMAKALGRLGDLPPLRLLSVGSEGWPAADFRELADRLHPDSVVVNAFGATETTVDSLVLRPDPAVVGDSAFVPLGLPVQRTTAHVLDDRLCPVAPGETGDLYIGGAGIARGYQDRGALTASRFVADPFAAGGRLYRTGDVVRPRADGNLDYLGRADDQVKIRGFRVEPGEIEDALLSHPGVVRAAVAVRSGVLVGYVEATASPDELRVFLAGRLPPHMVPRTVLVLDRLPVLPNGKLDRRALPEPASPAPPAAAATGPERALARIWADVLGVAEVGVHDNFFDLGGDSILGIQVAATVRAELGLAWPYQALFDRPTIAGLAAVLTPVAEPTAVAATGDRLPLSFAQQPLWFLHKHAPAADYNIGKALRLTGPLDVSALTAALTTLVARQESLRTTFDEVDGRGVQVVNEPSPVWIEIVDCSGLAPADRDAAMRRLLRDEAGFLFDLRQGPLLRPTLLRMSEHEHVLVLMMHHIVTDDWANEILLSELAACYTAARDGVTPALPDLPARYADFGLRQRQRQHDDQLDYWRGQLAGLPRTEIRPDRPRPASGAGECGEYRTVLPAEVTLGLKDLSREHRVSLFTTLVAACQVLFARYARQRDVAVGTVTAGRDRAEWADLVGFFVNTLVIRSTVDERQSFAGLLAAVRETVLNALANSDVSFEQVVRALAPERDATRSPLVDIMVVMQNAPGRDRAFAGLDVEEIDVPLVNVAFDLTVEFREAGDHLRLYASYNADMYEPATIEALIGQLQELLVDVVAAPARPLHLSAAPGGVECPRTGTRQRPAHELFEDWARRIPDVPAVVHGSQRLTYRELDERADRLARSLAARGVRPEVPVGLRVGRGVDLIVSMLAVLKAGGAMVPLDPSYPAERLDFMLADTGVRVVVTPEDMSPRGDTVPSQVQPGNAAYVVYTSGSTGQPKGVVVTHGALAALAAECGRRLALGPTARMLFHLSAGFDGGIFQTLIPLFTGATVCVSEAGERDGTISLTGQVNRDAITTVVLPPALLSTLDPRSVPGVLAAYSAADVCPPELARKWAGRAFGNLYGPTEATIMTAAHLFEPEALPDDCAVVPVGGSFGDARCHVLDPYLRPVAPGMYGELYIGGDVLARGYAGRPDGTAERFVANPFGPGRMYRSGDLVRRRADGVLEFHGRVDHQVKVRGYRIEPGEIETALTRHPDVTDAVVVAREGRLVAYVTPDAAVDLPGFLSETLPGHLVPSVFVPMAAFPLNHSGKVDRARLPEPARPRTGNTAPRTPVERALATAFSAVLGIGQIGVHDNFFELGGDSILSIQIVSALARDGLRITSRDIFRHQTIARLAAVVSAEPQRPATEEPEPGLVALTPIQQWFFEHFSHCPDHFTMPRFVELAADVDEPLVRRAVEAVIRHHDALRTRARQVDGEWRLEVLAEETAEVFARAEVSGETDADIARHVAAAHAGLSLSQGPLLKATYLHTGDRPRLLLMAHHLVVDGVSWRILLADLRTAYLQLAAGEPVDLGIRTTSIGRWSRRLAEYARSGGFDHEVPYWVKAQQGVSLSGAEPAEVSTTELVTVRLDADATKALLREVPAVYRTKPNDVLLYALTRVLSAWSGGDRVRINLEGHGREQLFDDLDVSRTVGWFTIQYPVTIRLETAKGIGAALKSVKEQLREIPAHGIGYDALRYLAGAGELGAGTHADVNFNYMGQFAAPDRRGSFYSGREFPVTDGIHPAEARPFELEVSGEVVAGELVFRWDYSTARHDRAVIRRLADEMVAVLAELIAHCRLPGSGGRTPSDFPLARLSQAEVDDLVRDGRAVEDVYPLTPLQSGLLYHALSTEIDVYARRIAMVVEGVTSTRNFADAWRQVVAAVPAWRTTVHWAGLSEPVQVVHRDVRPRIDELDWRSLAPEEQRERFDRLVDQERAGGFDLGEAVLRLVIVRLSDTVVQVLVVTHHLFIDGWSVSRALDQVFAICAGRREPIVDRPFRDYVEWLRQQDDEQAAAHWRRVLAGFGAPTPLPHDRMPKPNHQTSTTRTVSVPFGDGARLQSYARRHRLTVNTIVQAAWALLLARHGGVTDVIYGTTVSTRPATLPGAETITGPLINTLPARVTVDHSADVAEWLTRLQHNEAESREYAHFPLSRQHAHTDLPPGVRMFDSTIAVENYPGDPFAQREQGMRVVELSGDDSNSYHLGLVVYPGADLSLLMSYDTELFEETTARRLAGHLSVLLAGLTEDTARTVADVPMLTAPEQALLEDWSQSPIPAAEPRCAHVLFAEQVRRDPQAMAVHGSLTYADLDARSNALAHRLIELDVGPEVFVGVHLGNSVDYVVSVLAILKAGGAFVPLDPEYPAERLSWMVEDSGAVLVLTGSESTMDWTVPVLAIDDAPALPVTAPTGTVRPQSPAYVIYTSGSTGRPKGVVVTHIGLAGLAATMTHATGAGPGCRVMFWLSVGFDAVVLEIVMSLFTGATAVLSPIRVPGRELAAFAVENGVTHMIAPPAVLAILPADDMPGITVLSGGEVCTGDLVARWSRNGRIVNGYGPTEATVCTVLTGPLTGSRTPPIGRPSAGTQAFLLDGRLRQVPVGAVGEIHLAGDLLARGYLGLPGLTARTFVANPFGPGRMLRTGDLARRGADGALYFVGRADDQVKVRGFRIEPGEIEAALLRHPQVTQAYVRAVGDGPTRRLVAYVAPLGITPAELRTALDDLPEHLVPSSFVPLDQLPVTVNGKVDREALPDSAAVVRTDHVAPRTDTERAVAEIWAGLIGRPDIGIREKFFEAGGSSLTLVQLSGRLAGLGLGTLGVGELLDHSTIEAMAARLDRPPAGPADYEL